jgi:hypothetical protein
MSMTPLTDVGAHVKQQYANGQETAAGVAVVLTAGATEDGVKVTGQSIDRKGFDSVSLATTVKASLAATETIALAVEYQTSSDNSTWATAVAMQASTVLLTGGGGGTDEEGCLELNLNLSTLPRYIRFNVTPTMSAGATDTAVWTSTATLGGAKYSTDA